MIRHIDERRKQTMVKVLRLEVADPVFTKKEICRHGRMGRLVRELADEGWVLTAAWPWKRPLSGGNDRENDGFRDENGVGLLLTAEADGRPAQQKREGRSLYMTAYCYQEAAPAETYDSGMYTVEYQVIGEAVGEHLCDGWEPVSARGSDPVRVEQDGGIMCEIPGIKVRFRKRLNELMPD